MHKITVVLLNLRFFHFCSPELFKRVKDQYKVRFVAILDQQFDDQIASHIHPYLDQIYLLPSLSKDGFLAEFDFQELTHIMEKEQLQADEIKIVCSDEFNLLNAGSLRKKYGVQGHTDDELIKFRDKLKMKEILQNAGIRVPRFKNFSPEDSFLSLSSTIGLPFVIKPIDSCGSYGVYIIKNQNDYQECKIFLENCSAKFQVEEYIQGKLYHVDSCLNNHVITFVCAN